MTDDMSNEHAPGRKKDGPTWYDRKGAQWQRYWCGADHGTGRPCTVSIPVKTGKTRPADK